MAVSQAWIFAAFDDDSVWGESALTLHTGRPSAGSRPPPRTAKLGVSSAPATAGKPVSRFRKPIIIGLAVLLGWAVLTQSLVAYLSDTYPKVAYWIHATPTVLLNLADDKLNADAAKKVVEPVLSDNLEHASRQRSYTKGIQSIEKLDAQPDAAAAKDGSASESNAAQTSSTADNLSEADYSQVQIWAEQALRQDPLNARALRILAQVAEHKADDDRTKALMQGAAERSPQESLAVFWMMRENFQERNYAEAIRYADILLGHGRNSRNTCSPCWDASPKSPQQRRNYRTYCRKIPPGGRSFSMRYRVTSLMRGRPLS